jgi:hypothetical protein
MDAFFTAWHDPAFRAKLTADPHAALAGAGITIPTGMTIKYVEDNPHARPPCDRPGRRRQEHLPGICLDQIGLGQ